MVETLWLLLYKKEEDINPDANDVHNQIMRKECLENMMLTRYIEGNGDKGEQRITDFTRLSKCMLDQGVGTRVKK